MDIGSCSVFVAFRCALFYTTFLSFLFLTSVNAQPLSCRFFFLRRSPHIKKTSVFSFLCLRLRFFYFLIFLLIFGYTLPTPWARLAPFGIDLGTILGLTFPRFPPPALNSCRDFARNLQRTGRELAENYQTTYKKCKELAENYQQTYAKNFPKSDISSGRFSSSF